MNSIKQKISINSKRAIIVFIAFLSVMGGGLSSFKYVKAQSIQDQINQLQAENDKSRDAVDQLQEQATSYEDAIKQLKAKIDDLQGKIAANSVEQARLNNEIKAAEAELDKQKNLLGENIRAMYVEGDMSTIEMLASSKDLSEFIDKEQYRNSVKDKITETLDKITELKHALRSQKERVDALLKQQQDQRAELASNKAEKSNLLSYNKEQQASFNNKVQANQQKIEELIASQRASNFNPDGGYYFLRFPGSIKSFNPNNYPYKNAGFGMSLGGCVDNDGPDKWGYCTRQCVSYAAWAVEASGREAPRYYGSARNWVEAAYLHGIPVYRNPKAGDVAISTSGTWGHAMYVQSVSGSSFNTSEYNTNLDGRLYYRTRSF